MAILSLIARHASPRLIPSRHVMPCVYLRTYASSVGDIKHSKLRQWIEDKVSLCKPDKVHICTGTDGEFNTLLDDLVSKGFITKLNDAKRPNSYLARTDPGDVARAENLTFICSEKEKDCGITNNWIAPAEMKKQLNVLFDGCMKGRTMYVIPYSMGPLGSDLSKIGIELTDSSFVVANMKIMTRMGTSVLEQLGTAGSFVPCMHSVGKPLAEGDEDVAWPCNLAERRITHFPDTREIWSFGSGYGGNSLLGKKCFALRIASVLARDEGWLAEHMLILGVTSPEGVKKYVAAAFPSACGKTNFAMLCPTLPGWKVECVGDDIAWMKIGKDGRLYAINPEAGFFGVAPGTAPSTNPHAMSTAEKNSIFTNVALTSDGDVWWEGIGHEPSKGTVTDWLGKAWDGKTKAAHPNSRFTVPASQCPVISNEFDNPAGVPIDAIIFGGRRPTTIPLVYESKSWQHGTFIGASISSEKTAAAEGSDVGQLRHDPFAMLPFCGYNMGDYFNHWLKFGSNGDQSNLPKIFHVNWFQQDKSGKFIWPGFGENSRVLKWICERLDGKDNYEDSPIGHLPKLSEFDLTGLELDDTIKARLFSCDKEKWVKEIDSCRKYLGTFGDDLPKGLVTEMDALEARLKAEEN